jgi:NAD(P)-dependent dehydrogenase (short-subunit alcohol dehydrogenase family)
MPFAVVTGANRGLGLATSKKLAELGWHVLLTARDAAAGREAAQSLGAGERVQSAQLDVADPASVERLARELADRPTIDALVNNAGASLHGFDADVARRTLDINYGGPVRTTEALKARLSAEANVVMVSSGMGELSHLGKELRARLLDPSLDRAGLDAIADQFVSAVAERRHGALGFPNNAYGVSKALLNAFTRLLGKEFQGSGRRVNSVCPGWVQTRMGGEQAPRSVERGAAGIVWAATLTGSGPNAGFFRDGKAIDW